MGELTIRRNRGFTVPRYQVKTEKQTGSSRSQGVAKAPGFTISETLRQLMTRVSQAESHSRESRRTLQRGEAALAEVQDGLERMAELARSAAGEGEPDRAALQAELERLLKEIDRIVGSASTGDTQLFLDEGAGIEDGLETLLFAVTGETADRQALVQPLPDWLMRAMVQSPLTPEQLLARLGLDKTASPEQLLAAIANISPEDSDTVGYLAALYLGAVIAGSDLSGELDPIQALEGLQRLLEKVAEGMPPDQAVSLLTDGKFTSILDFQEQFAGGTAPGLQDFLVNLLLSDSGASPVPTLPMVSLFPGMEGMNLELLMGLLNAVQGAEAPAIPELGGSADAPAPAEAAPGPASTLQLGGLQVMGRDLSGVSYDSSSGVLTIDGPADVILRGTAQGTVLLTGSGRVTLQSARLPLLMADGPAPQVFSTGDSAVEQLRLGESTSLTLGGGQLKIGVLHSRAGGVLHLAPGTAAAVEGEDRPTTLTVPVLADGPVLLAAPADSVRDAAGRPMEFFDLVWKALLPGWSGITSLSADGTKLSLWANHLPDPARLWLARGDQGSPIHTLVIQGRDQAGRPKTRYAYLLWNRQTEAFEEISMYPNPFTITGGEAGRDWIYEEESHTLHILSSQVTAVAGGSGTDAACSPFSGRISLADRIGAMELTLGGVVCRVSSGRALSLGCENDITLLLDGGTDNIFESGAGCAGISLGDGTTLHINSARLPAGSDAPIGTLTAIGGTDGAGIGRDSGGSRIQSSRIFILGGVITAAGTGGGAGIGAGKRGFMGPITMTGGTVTSTGGKSGGAGIGAGLGAPVGDIVIRGGTVTASATCHAAAIGAGVQGECGDILITGTARITKALGGNPGADIGACLFGGCGQVLISGGADIGTARLSTRTGVCLRMGEDSVTLPQFRLSSRALQLDTLDFSTRQAAQEAEITLDADRRWVAQIQGVYDTLYSQLEQSFGGLSSVCQYFGTVRDDGTASTLLKDMRQSILLQPSQALRTHGKRGTEDVGQLLK